MKNIQKAAIVTAAALALAVGSYAGAKAEIGKAAPDFTLTDINGQKHSLSDFAGKIVVLEWVNHGCPFVQKHYNSGNMPGLQAKYTAEDVVWLSICSSAEGQQGYYSARDWQSVAKKKDMSSTAVLIDESGEVGHLYNAKTTPHMYVIDQSGTLVYNGGIDNDSRASDPSQTPSYVAAALDAVLAGKPVEVATSTPYGCNVKYK